VVNGFVVDHGPQNMLNKIVFTAFFVTLTIHYCIRQQLFCPFEQPEVLQLELV